MEELREKGQVLFPKMSEVGLRFVRPKANTIWVVLSEKKNTQLEA